MRLALALILVAALPAALPATAQDWMSRPGDTGFSNAELDTRLRGNILTFYDDGQSEFYDDGRYTYTYANDGGTGYGYWEITGDSTVCIEFVNGFSRCDRYVRNGDRLILQTADGERFPIRP